MLPSHLVKEPGFVGRFEREAAAPARLRRPNIVRLSDFEAAGTLAFIPSIYFNIRPPGRLPAGNA